MSIGRDLDIDDTGETIAISFHVCLSEFNDIIGPNIISINPPIHPPFLEPVRQIIPHLLDIDLKELKQSETGFFFSCEYFLSNNIGFTLPKLLGRAGESEYLLSLIITPSDPRAHLVLANMRHFLPTIREACVSTLLKYHQDDDIAAVRAQLKEDFLQFYDAVSNFLEIQLSSFGEGIIKIKDYTRDD